MLHGSPGLVGPFGLRLNIQEIHQNGVFITHHLMDKSQSSFFSSIFKAF